MEKNIVSIYRKIKIYDNLYIFKFLKIMRNVDYDYKNNEVIFNFKGHFYKLKDLKNININNSKETIFFGEFEDLENLKKINNFNKDQTIKNFIKECKSNIKFYEIEKNKVKNFYISVENLKETLVENEMNNDILSSEIPIQLEISFFKSVLEKLRENDFNSVLNIFEQINNVYEEQFGVLEKKQHQQKSNIKSISSPSGKSLDDMIGLENIKNEVKKLQSYLEFYNMTKENLNLEAPNLNMVFYGNPGTGKTTVANDISNLLNKLGFTKNNKFIETTTEDFIGQYVGQSAPKTRNLIEKYSGGVIFIDEAYSFNSKAQEYADEALVEIIKEMEKGKTIFIFSGYKDEMDEFIKMNPGLKSRINYYLEFKDYSLEELCAMFMLKIKESKLNITDEAFDLLIKVIKIEMTNKHFGNGRFIKNLFDKIVMNHANNIITSGNLETLTTIKSDDIERNINKIDKVKKLGF